LHEAIGRPVLTAAAKGKPAFEVYEGDGVFTWGLLDALKNSDRNGNGYIEPSERGVHVQDQVNRCPAEWPWPNRSCYRGVNRWPTICSDYALIKGQEVQPRNAPAR
jgi:hypothetical protein